MYSSSSEHHSSLTWCIEAGDDEFVQENSVARGECNMLGAIAAAQLSSSNHLICPLNRASFATLPASVSLAHAPDSLPESPRKEAFCYINLQDSRSVTDECAAFYFVGTSRLCTSSLVTLRLGPPLQHPLSDALLLARAINPQFNRSQTLKRFASYTHHHCHSRL